MCAPSEATEWPMGASGATGRQQYASDQEYEVQGPIQVGGGIDGMEAIGGVAVRHPTLGSIAIEAKDGRC